MTDLLFDVVGEGAPLLLLHPGGADSRAWQPLLPHLDGYRAWMPDRRGQGRTPDTDAPFSFATMAADTIAFIETEVGEPVHLVGYSDGGIVALAVAIERPDLLLDAVFAASVFHREGWGPGVIDGDGEWPDFMVDAYAEVSPDGREHFPVIARKMAEQQRAEPTFSERDLGSVTVPSLVLVGDDDEPTLEHTIAFYRALPKGELCVVPNTSHGLVVEKPELVATILRDFHVRPKPDTIAPRRRAEGAA